MMTEINQKESVKLSKGMNGKFSYELKILAEGEKLVVGDLKRLEDLNKELIWKYGEVTKE